MTQVRLVLKNQLNWTLFVCWDWFYLLEELPSRSRFVFYFNWPTWTLPSLHSLHFNTAYPKPLSIACCSFRPGLQFLCCSQINSSFGQFGAGLSLPLFRSTFPLPTLSSVFLQSPELKHWAIIHIIWPRSCFSRALPLQLQNRLAALGGACS